MFIHFLHALSEGEILCTAVLSALLIDIPTTWVHLFGYLRRIHDFDTFVSRVAGIPFRLAEPHFIDQYGQMYTKEGACQVHFIGKVENLKVDFEPIRERFNLLPLPHLNRAASLTGKNRMDYYTLHTAKLVYQKYKKDFITFGYTEEYEKLKDYLKNKKVYNYTTV